MMNRRNLFKRLGGAIIAAVATEAIPSASAPAVYGPREQQVLDLFQIDPLKALALARTFIRVDPEWRKTDGFIKLAVGPFGKYVMSSPENDWDRSDLYLGWKPW
jgi:hypothetical protein